MKPLYKPFWNEAELKRWNKEEKKPSKKVTERELDEAARSLNETLLRF